MPGWHLDCIAEHLEAVERREILSLLINVPPRHMKSLLVAVFWPMWVWTKEPSCRWMFNSYAETLSVRDSLKSRRLIQSGWYQERWGDVYQLTGDQNMKTRFENDKTGYRIAASVGGSNTGEGGDIIVADDPHNVVEAESDVIRESVLTWWDETMSTRLNDPKTGRRVIVMQRVHEQDLAGHVLENRGYHHLCLPAEWEPAVYVQGTTLRAPGVPQPHDTCPIAQDPRTKDGELLWPERYGAEEIARLVVDMGTYAAAGQLQQRPTPRAGAMFRSDWFRALPSDFETRQAKLPRIAYADLAWSEKQSADYTSVITVSVDLLENTYLRNAWRERIDEHALSVRLADHLAIVKPHVLGIEEGAYKQKPTQDLIRLLLVELRKRGVAVAVSPVKVTTDKVFRAQLPSSRAKLGMVFVDRSAPWWPTLEKELLMFPKGAHDDQVDALSGAMQMAIEVAVQAQARQQTPQKYGFKTAADPGEKRSWVEDSPSVFVTAGGDGKVHPGQRGWEK